MNAVDLFAGAGGLSEGARQAGTNIVWAGNHNPIAVQYHQANHPTTIHACQDLHQVDWNSVPAHDLLLAAPCCQGHSRARGKDRPHHDTQRSTAWAVISCIERHHPAAALIENVPEFLQWSLYPSWLDAMQRLGYSVSPHITDAADHGVPQHRVRLLLVCTRSKHPLRITLSKRDHVSIGNVIMWDSHAWSLIDRPGRSPATLQRIVNGRARFGQRFIAPYYGSGSGTTGRSIDRPIGTITTRDRWAIIDGDNMRMLQPSEAKTAMGFPDSYVFPKNKHDAMLLMGNAVPPPVARDFVTALRMAA